jgi:tetratricopeptide (TPR) repeat protein
MSFAPVNIINNSNTEILNIIEKNKNLFELGNTYEKLNEHYKAISECYITILQTDPQNIGVLNQIGICYSSLGQNKLAIHYFK